MSASAAVLFFDVLSVHDGGVLGERMHDEDAALLGSDASRPRSCTALTRPGDPRARREGSAPDRST
ncbi:MULTISPECIES: hypothetical protein [unclassified Streptomyces]|uniref:hypothetical protein n=1 Tax=unclassified Streptomyces TaxID=2593676 RepID=UPI0036F7A814